MHDAKITAERFGLGRVQVDDHRDLQYPVAPLLASTQPHRKYRYWNAQGAWMDQGALPHCVAYAWSHWGYDGPVTQKKASLPDPGTIYRRAQQIDEWPGENYDGTSVRAGAKIMRELGYVAEFRWAFTLDEVVQTVLTVGPVVAGTYWYQGMFYPNAEGIIVPTGYLAGGHAYLINGVNTSRKVFRIKNSWGREWGRKGHAYISFEHFDSLLRRAGEACVAVENKLVA